MPADVLRGERAPSLQDALNNLPGVAFSYGDGQRDQVTVRGLTMIADHHLDGLPKDSVSATLRAWNEPG